METLNLIPNTPEWHAHRATGKNASEASAMLGCSPYMTRDALLQAMHTGIRSEATPDQQRRYDAGHAVEAKKRSVAEAIIGEDLYPVVGSAEVDGMVLSASFDGLTLMEETDWECKSLNEALRTALPNPGPDGNDAANLPKFYRVQMEQQCAVSGCTRVLFTASNGEDDDRHCWYYPDPALRAEIIAGWRQFDIDLAAYVPVEVLPPAVAAPTLALPAVSIQVQGSIALISNLDVFGAELKAFVSRIPEKPSTDQEFADCKAAIGKLQDAQDALDAAESSALAQVATFDEMRRTKALYWELARTTRLAVEKLVAAREQAIKVEAVQKGKDDFAAHIASLNARLGKPYMPTVAADFAGAIKNKRTVASLQNAVATELARVKIESSAIADKIQINLTTLRELATAHAFLFADTAQIVLKAPDDLTMLVKARIAEHTAAEEKKEADTRDRIRKEEQEKAEKDARDKLAREAEEQRLADEATKRAAAATELAAAKALPDGAELSPAAQALNEQEGEKRFAAVHPSAAPAANVVPMRAAAPAPVAAPNPAPTASADAWQPAETMPKMPDQWIQVQEVNLYRFLPYKTNSTEYKRGKKGRWQRHNGYGFENSEPPVGQWRIGEEVATAETA